MSSSASVVVIGAGAYGTALAIMLSRNGHKVLLWGHDPLHIYRLKTMRCHHLLPKISFPALLLIEKSLQVALSFAHDIIIAVPSRVFSDVLVKLKPYLRCNSRIILATKGLEAGTGRLLQNVVREILGQEIPLAIISGPTFAREIAMGLPTAIVLVASDSVFIADLRNLLQCNNKNFMVYVHSDYIGIQLAGAIKNVIAIGSGISDGIGFGANARAALITCGLAEMSRLGVAMGSELDIFTGMAGLGDLVLTCTDDQSRNRRFGILLGRGVEVSNAMKKIGQVVEGFNNAYEVRALSRQYNVIMPIVEQIYRVLYCGRDVYKAAFYLVKLTMK
ncbi:Glycerol-3-phosphate dehydrogenase [NAD(P)+] [Blochmannia endosymbiont of Camponotus (Colobopsis) obliquus]|nr:Glycerol-3-phosphate dehydrogenase [NAD(P)+] [Blochmannia endosymbiont of Camponotus (Colobopsis) obliquus]